MKTVDLDSFENMLEQSYNEDGVLVFKHSTPCSVSSWVWRNLKKEWDSQIKKPVYFLDLLKKRDISNTIAHRLNMRHESPQLLWVKNGEAAFHASHSDANVDQLKRHLLG